jgi:hypothetical protein
VHAGGVDAITGSDGVAHLQLAAGHYSVYADQPTRIRSFTAAAEVK